MDSIYSNIVAGKFVHFSFDLWHQEIFSVSTDWPRYWKLKIIGHCNVKYIVTSITASPRGQRTSCYTGDNVSLIFHNCHYSIYNILQFVCWHSKDMRHWLQYWYNVYSIVLRCRKQLSTIHLHFFFRFILSC